MTKDQAIGLGLFILMTVGAAVGIKNYGAAKYEKGRIDQLEETRKTLQDTNKIFQEQQEKTKQLEKEVEEYLKKLGKWTNSVNDMTEKKEET